MSTCILAIRAEGPGYLSVDIRLGVGKLLGGDSRRISRDRRWLLLRQQGLIDVIRTVGDHEGGMHTERSG